MKSSLRLANNLKHLKFLARYQNWPTSYPTPYPKPMNPLDNIDPSRKNKDLVDEYDKINKNLPPGSEPPEAWRASKEFPDWYRPYLLNYNGHGFLIVFFSFFVLCYFIQKEHIKKIKGRKVLKDYTHEKKVIYSPFKNNQTIAELKNNPDPYLRYLKRYIKESGF